MKTAISILLTAIILSVGICSLGMLVYLLDKNIWLYAISLLLGTFTLSLPAGEYWYNLIKSKL